MERFDPAWALRPEALELVVELVSEGRTNVIECGSGVSTVTIARALSALGRGHVHALEHDSGWAATARTALADEELAEFATVVHAPLVDGWYDRAALGELPAGGVNVLLVDGPPAGEPGIERSRYPALPELAGRLAWGAAIVLDDADRDGERWALERWLAEFPISPRPGPPGVAVAMYRPDRQQGWQTTNRRGRNERNS
jgi:predicted O-methyltransferase YrrM